MEIKKVLRLLNNQYFKSFKRFKKIYSVLSGFRAQVKRFNSGYLKLIGTILNGDVNEISASLYNSFFYIYATRSERDKLDAELLGIF